MTGEEFIRKVRKLGRKRGVDVWVDTKRGKGSHVMLYYGSRRTVVCSTSRDLGAGLLRAMCDQIGIDIRDL